MPKFTAFRSTVSRLQNNTKVLLSTQKGRAITLGSSLISLILVLIISAGLLNQQESANKRGSELYSFPWAIEDSVLPNTVVGPDFIYIMAKVVSIDTNANLIKLYISFTPAGKYVGKLHDIISKKTTLSTDISLSFNDKLYAFKKGETMSSLDLLVSLASATPNSYPFDSYEGQSLFLSGTSGNASIPLLVGLSGFLQAWKISAPVLTDVSYYKSGEIVQLTVALTRSLTTKFFSLFVFCLLWTVSILVFGLALSVVVRNRKIEPPTIVVTTSLLFALPTLRNIQPGIPPIGVELDVIGFFWNMILAVGSVCLVLQNYIQKYQADPIPDTSKNIVISEKEVSEDKKIIKSGGTISKTKQVSFVFEEDQYPGDSLESVDYMEESETASMV